MGSKRLIVSGLLASVLILTVPITSLAASPSNFEQGKQAFKKGNYQGAVEAFERARKAGVRRVSLYYNLGVSYYKLGRYKEAKKNFKIVKRNKRMAPLANYNLGLVAEKEKQRDVAKKYYSTVLKTSRDKKLRALAQRNLDKLRDKLGVWKGAVSAKIGYDSNVTSAAAGTPAGASSFLAFSAFTNNLLRGTRRDGLYLTGDILLTEYMSQNEDQSAIRAGLKKTTMWGKHRAHYAGYLSGSTYRGSAYQSKLTFEAGTRRNYGKGKSFRTRYRYENISSQNAAYDYLQGWRQKLRVERRNYSKDAKLRYYYELELNDRQDTGTASYSPMRHTVRASYGAPLSRSWDWKGDLSYRISSFPLVVAPQRSDNRWRLSFSASKKISKDLKFRTRLRHTNNSSTVTTYNYNSNQIYAGFSYYY